MAEKTEYELNLKDNFSKPLEDAKHSAEGFHESVMHIVEALGLVELAHEAFDFLKESLSEFDKHQVVLASLTQMYNNNSASVSVNIDELKELAEAQEKLTGVRSEDTMQAEQNLLKFREIRISYEELIPVIGDFAKATGDTAAGAANMLGRALENPEHAMRLLIQAGVSPAAIQNIENLQKMGHVAQAQQQIFEALKDKYHGVAKAMFDASPAEQMAVSVKELKEKFGQLEENLLKRLIPAIKSVFNFINETIGWLKEHKQQIKEVTIVVGILASGFLAYKAVLIAVATWEKITSAAMVVKNVIMELSAAYTMALEEGYGTLEAAQWALNVAMNANPLAIVITAVSVLTAGIYLLIQSYNEANAIMNGDNQRAEGFKTESASVVALADKYVKLGMAKEDAMKKAISFEKNTLFDESKNIERLISKTGDPDKRLALERQMLNLSGQFSALSDKEGLINSYTKAQGGKTENPLKPKADQVAGTSHVTINVSIQKMTGIEHFVSTTVKGAQAAGENIEKMMLAAINQFQASADV